MQIQRRQKGFTLVELLVVIAIIAILATVSIIGYTQFIEKAKVSNDTQLVRNLNERMQLYEAENGYKQPTTAHEAFILTEDFGFIIEKLTPTSSGNDIVWDMTTNRFALINAEDLTKVVYSDPQVTLSTNPVDLWKVYKEVPKLADQKYSIYLAGTNLNGSVDAKVGVDVGRNTKITEINYENWDEKRDVVIRTNGGTLTVNAPLDTVKHYGNADKVDVQAVANASYHENGTIQLIAVKQGHVKLEGEAEVNGIYVYNNSQGETKDTSFAEIKITVDNGVDVPKLFRSAVEVQPEGTKVCTVVTDQAKDIYLFNEGIYEQIKTVDAGKNVASDASATWADNSTKNTENTQTAAMQLANEFNGTYDAETGKIADKKVTVEGTEYTVKFNEETRTFETYQGEEKVTDTTVVEAVAEVADVSSEAGKTVEEAAVASALKGSGTEADPFLVYDYATMQKISDFYDKGYYYFAVALDKTDNGKIDLKNNAYIKLNGSFDGKGVKLVNVNAGIFGYVGSRSSTAKKVTLSNFDVVFDGGFGIAQVCATPILEFNNVNVTGYLLEDWNAAVFLRYGSASAVSDGFDYSVSFNNCSSRAEIYSSTNPYSAILVGHGYQGSGNTVTINVDSETDNNINNTILYYTGTGAAFGYKYYCMTSGNTVVNVNNEQQYSGVWASFTNNKMTGNNVVAVLSNKVPTKTSEGDYQLTPEVDTAKIVVSLNWQYTEWETNYSAKIDNLSGVGGTFSDKIVIEVEDNDSVVVFDKITSIEIRTGQSEWIYEFNNGKLILNMTTSNPYIDGHITLIVEQFTRGSSIAKYKGSLELATKTTSAEWVIK